MLSVIKIRELFPAVVRGRHDYGKMVCDAVSEFEDGRKGP